MPAPVLLAVMSDIFIEQYKRSDKIKQGNLNRDKKYLNIKKVGDDLLKKKGPAKLPNNRFSNPGEMPKHDIVQNNQIHNNYS